MIHHAGGTDPSDVNYWSPSFFGAKVHEGDFDGPDVVLRWKSSAGKRYLVQSSEDLTGRWHIVAWGIAGQPGETALRLPIRDEDADKTELFYRVQTAP